MHRAPSPGPARQCCNRGAGSVRQSLGMLLRARHDSRQMFQAKGSTLLRAGWNRRVQKGKTFNRPNVLLLCSRAAAPSLRTRTSFVAKELICFRSLGCIGIANSGSLVGGGALGPAGRRPGARKRYHISVALLRAWSK